MAFLVLLVVFGGSCKKKGKEEIKPILPPIVLPEKPKPLPEPEKFMMLKGGCSMEDGFYFPNAWNNWNNQTALTGFCGTFGISELLVFDLPEFRFFPINNRCGNFQEVRFFPDAKRGSFYEGRIENSFAAAGSKDSIYHSSLIRSRLNITRVDQNNNFLEPIVSYQFDSSMVADPNNKPFNFLGEIPSGPRIAVWNHSFKFFIKSENPAEKWQTFEYENKKYKDILIMLPSDVEKKLTKYGLRYKVELIYVREDNREIAHSYVVENTGYFCFMDLKRDPITTDPNHRYWKEIIRRDDPEFGKYWLKETIWLDEEQAKNSFKTLNINLKK